MKVPVSLLGLLTLAAGQNAAPVFEVASVKPAAPANSSMSFEFRKGGGVRIGGATLRDLILSAWNIQNFQLSGGPGWANSARFDVIAKPDSSSDDGPVDYGTMTLAEVRGARELSGRRLQALLSERFQLVLRRETKEMPIYALALAKGGVKATAAKETDGMAYNAGPGHILCRGCPMERFVSLIARIVSRPVHDETGLIGKYDFKLDWTPDTAPRADRWDFQPADLSAPEAPSLFSALQETLGLKLDARKGPVDVYVIERAEKPSEN